MDESKLSALVGKTSRFTDSHGDSADVIVTRNKADDPLGRSGIEGYSMTLLEQYFTNLVGTRLPVFDHDRIEAY